MGECVLPEVLTLSTFLGGMAFLFVLLRFFSVNGAYVYIALTTILANTQAVRVASYSFLPDPVALGTELFVTTFIAENILIEYWGNRVARKGIALSFLASLFFMSILKITILYPEIPDAYQEHSLNKELAILTYQLARLFWASCGAYITSQLLDIMVFSWLRAKLQGRFLLGRVNISALLAAFCDHLFFSLLAWRVLCSPPISWASLFGSYICGIFGLRCLLIFIGSFFVPLARFMIRPSDHE
ncbi:MAG: queuosine precursor transporter [Holosporales bacterium]|jgi:uncharacterized integral membrane protein (TIGR00697 family)|nr:queuosine precursor transporter [Holosporales bacterium]